MITDIKQKKKKTKIGELKVNSPAYFGFSKRPIWAWVENNYWTDGKNAIVINVNFNKQNELIASMLYSELLKIQKKGINVDLHDTCIHLRGHNNSNYQKIYYKLFINIDPSIIGMDYVINKIHNVVIQSTTEFKHRICDDKLEKFKSRAVAELL